MSSFKRAVSILFGVVIMAIASIVNSQEHLSGPAIQVSQSAPIKKSLSFDVVSVKPNKTDESFPGSMIGKDGFYAQNTTPIWIMFYAYDLDGDRNDNDFSGLPDWAKSERFDAIAKVAGTDVEAWKKLQSSDRQLMVRDVLAERFNLRLHTETHERPIYALVLAKGGPKMQPVEVPANDHSPYGPSGYTARDRDGTTGHHVTMKVLALYLNKLGLGRQVQDQTGLTGHYDFTLKFAPLSASFGNADKATTPTDSATTPTDSATTPADSATPFIFTALQEQLGLKLVPTNGSVETLVVDHIERPSAN
jgi:uncharacterized protein (TIGR03435 family)